MKTIAPADLIPMDLFEQSHALRIEVAYARSDNLLFGQAIYKPDARLWLHVGLAPIVLLAARLCHERHGLAMVLYDGLRTVEAQALMLETQRVRDNPHWLEEPRLLSPPGTGAHPRGMAIDIALETPEGRLIDMGTPFDYLAADPSPEANPAHRDYAGLTPGIAANRAMLDNAMLDAARALKTELFPLPQEWWDFRLPNDVSGACAPLSDAGLPPQMRMTHVAVENGVPDFPEGHFSRLKAALLEKILMAATTF